MRKTVVAGVAIFALRSLGAGTPQPGAAPGQ